jgi:arylsulfatase A-like enzyme
MKTVGLGAVALGSLRCGSSEGQEEAVEGRPNVVFILADDMGWGDVKTNNPDSLIPTPNIDRLAEEGVVFSDAHSSSALCTPTRYGILTGRFYWRTHKKHSLVMPYDPPVIPPERLTWSRIMQEKGYTTAFIGKWHLGLWYPRKELEGFRRQYTMTEEEIDFEKPVVGGPCDLGFDYFFGTAGCSTSDAPYCFIRNDRFVGIPSIPTPDDMNAMPGVYPGLMVPDWDQEQVDATFVQESVDFIGTQVKENPDDPFFLYLALSAPHVPWVNPDFTRGASREGPRGDLCALVDWCVGEVRKALEANGVLDDTILIFTSDNGARTGENGQNSNGPFRGRKNTAYEGGHRIPLIVRWPGRIEPGRSSAETGSLNDMMATFAALVDYQLPEDAAEDSFNLLPAVLGKGTAGLARPALIADTGGHSSDIGDFSLRRDQWKLIEFNSRSEEGEPEVRYELFNLAQDPYETQDQAEVQSGIRDELIDLLKACKGTGLRKLASE